MDDALYLRADVCCPKGTLLIPIKFLSHAGKLTFHLPAGISLAGRKDSAPCRDVAKGGPGEPGSDVAGADGFPKTSQ